MKAAGLNHDDLKLRNRSHVLNAILENGVICRRDIAKLTGLTPATVSNLTAELVDSGIVEEIGADRSLGGEKGGPTPILLGISSVEPYVHRTSPGRRYPAGRYRQSQRRGRGRKRSPDIPAFGSPGPDAQNFGAG